MRVLQVQNEQLVLAQKELADLARRLADEVETLRAEKARLEDDVKFLSDGLDDNQRHIEDLEGDYTKLVHSHEALKGEVGQCLAFEVSPERYGRKGGWTLTWFHVVGMYGSWRR